MWSIFLVDEWKAEFKSGGIRLPAGVSSDGLGSPCLSSSRAVPSDVLGFSIGASLSVPLFLVGDRADGKLFGCGGGTFVLDPALGGWFLCSVLAWA
eukprot:SAG11_NODE_26699_length_342_cov_0.621399_1_plen_95_part_01